MGQIVYFELTSTCAAKGALCANKRLLSTVNQLVPFQLGSTDACVATLAAIVGLLSIMLKHMHLEVFGYLKGEIAMNT